jgi:hypothetical protein
MPPNPGASGWRVRVAAFAHPVTLLAIALFAFNEFVLTPYHPGLLSGKLSDFAGLVFFPLILEVFGLGRKAATLLTGLCFVLVKTVPLATALWDRFFDTLYATVGWADGAVNLIADPTDLLALVALLLPWRVIPTHSPRKTP